MLALRALVWLGLPTILGACAGPRPEERAPDVVAGRRGAGEVTCGAAVCDARAQLCCRFYEESRPPRCVARPEELPAADLPEAPYFEACTGPGETLAFADRCDGSEDCPSGERCCQDDLGTEAHQRRCSRGPCRDVEVCAKPGTCRTPDTQCAEGACRRVVTLACGGAACRAPERACCAAGGSGSLACVEPSSCAPSGPRIECLGPADCPADQGCELTPGPRTTCRGGVHDSGVVALLCAVDADCAGFLCAFGARCAEAGPEANAPPGVRERCACRLP